MSERHTISRGTRLRWLLAATALLVLLAAAVVILIIVTSAPPTSRVTQGAQADTTAACLRKADDTGCLRFPSVSGLNLLGEARDFPQDFTGALNLVIVPFSDEQQVSALTWLPLARELGDKNPELRFYNVPVFPDISPAIRVVIRAGMIALISDRELQAATTTLFLENRDDFLTALEITGIEQITALLVSVTGDVLWRGRGEYDDAQGAALRALTTAD